MQNFLTTPEIIDIGRPLKGVAEIPADKSINHRAILFAGIANGISKITTRKLGRDNLASIRVMTQLGVKVRGSLETQAHKMAIEEGLKCFDISTSDKSDFLEITSKGISSLKKPREVLDCGNSGTTSRLLMGILAGCPFSVELTGDSSLQKRPFKRVCEPLSSMGAKFYSVNGSFNLPMSMEGLHPLQAIQYESPIASAQVKSAILLAGISASTPSNVIEPWQSRDHTEKMLSSMGCQILGAKTPDGKWSVGLSSQGDEISKRRDSLSPLDIIVPGDFSAASFLIVAGLIIEGSDILIKDVGVNSTRIGLLDVLIKMNADISLQNRRIICGEEVADIRVRHSILQGCNVREKDVVYAIDEIPILAVAMSCAMGASTIHGAQELRVKESDRLRYSALILEDFGVRVEEYPDGLKIFGEGADKIKSSYAISKQKNVELWKKSGDHRIAMSGAILELFASSSCSVFDIPAIETSFPGFLQCLSSLA